MMVIRTQPGNLTHFQVAFWMEFCPGFLIQTLLLHIYRKTTSADSSLWMVEWR